MGCNYYARILPSKEEKEALKDAIDRNAFSEVDSMSQYLYKKRESYNLMGRVIHLGKSSIGWKFLWNHNIYKVPNGKMVDGKYVPDFRYDKIYDLNLDSIREFLNRDDVIIVSEDYIEGEQIDDRDFSDRNIMTTDEFIDFATSKDGWTSETYQKETGERSSYTYLTNDMKDIIKYVGANYKPNNSDFILNGLRFSLYTEFS